MTSPPQPITITCPSCGTSFESWWRASINLSLGEKFSDDYLREATIKTCPKCKFEIRLDTLLIGEDGVWRIGAVQDEDNGRERH